MPDSQYLDAALDALAALPCREPSGGRAARPIAIMDSGVGGLPYLEAARPLLPGRSFVYLADNAGFPYGTKSREEIETIVLDRVGRLVAAFDPEALLIACNTASQAALAAVRAAHPGLPVVGTVPAVKPAAERTKSGIIGVMATEQALVDPYLDELIGSHARGVKVLREPAQDLVAFVERDFVSSTGEGRRRAVEAHVERLVAAGADEIVLSCTHFLHVAPDIAALAAELAGKRGGSCRVDVVDSREGVARRLREVLGAGALGLTAGDAMGESGSGTGGGVFLLSGPPPFAASYSAFARLYGLEGPFSLESGR